MNWLFHFDWATRKNCLTENGFRMLTSPIRRLPSGPMRYAQCTFQMCLRVFVSLWQWQACESDCTLAIFFCFSPIVFATNCNYCARCIKLFSYRIVYCAYFFLFSPSQRAKIKINDGLARYLDAWFTHIGVCTFCQANSHVFHLRATLSIFLHPEEWEEKNFSINKLNGFGFSLDFVFSP